MIIVRCAEPYEMKGQSFLEITAKNEHMRCEDFYGRRPERDGPILVGIFIGVFDNISCKCSSGSRTLI